jgi:FkbM family methyltransferase
MRLVPHNVTYGIGKRLRATRLPYSLLKPGASVVQVGAPSDLLFAGRSRALYFAIFVGPSGRVLVVEPDTYNAEALRDYCVDHGHGNITVVPIGLWQFKGTLQFYVNDAHPASSFVEGVKKYDDKRMGDFRCVEIPVDTLDNVLRQYRLGVPSLVSITTNGSEENILKGMSRTIESGLPYISLARTGSGYEGLMRRWDYRFMGYDDRGYTFCLAQKDLSIGY